MDARVLETLRSRVGGDLKLATLFIKRLREIQRGLPPLVQTKSKNPWDIVAAEILQNKLALLTGEAAEKLRSELKTLTAMPEREFKEKVVEAEAVATTTPRREIHRRPLAHPGKLAKSA